MASTAEDTVSSEITEPKESTPSEPSESEEPSVSEEESKQQTENVEDTEEPAQPQQTATSGQSSAEEDTEMKMNVQVGGAVFFATLENNEAVSELVAMMQESPVVIEMSDYSGFEKVGPLGRSLTANNSQTTTHAGDIVLYNGNQIVIFYGSNSWSYTRLGHIDDLTGWEDALGSGDVTVTFSLE
ncbi:MAG: cyclophilin-like fold protein [Eubacteriales bacterium]|nr:cyclophilin-like fold protein [Eubacteriales bacterium]